MPPVKHHILEPGNGRAWARGEVSDQQIIEGLIAGRRWAAEAFYDRVSTVVASTLRRLVRLPETDCEDLQQMTLERVVRSLVQRRFSGSCSLSTWASAIAGHVAVDAIRNQMRERRVFLDHGDVESQTDARGARSWEGYVEARSDIAQLQLSLAAMNQAHAQTLVLHDALGHELTEIADIMGVSVAAAQSRLVRGRKELLRRAKGRIGGGENQKPKHREQDRPLRTRSRPAPPSQGTRTSVA